MIKPIQTVFKGHKFRSRLEARWAVFFDQLGFRYEYELEGFKLPSGACYLPDFFLTDFKVFVETKPTKDISLADLEKVVEFALEGDKSVLLIVGTPASEEMFLINRCSCPPVEEYKDVSFVEADVVANFLTDLHSDRVVFAKSPFPPGWHIAYHQDSVWHSFHLTEALLKAKQARFEFGETPK